MPIAEMLTILANFPCKCRAGLSPFCPPVHSPLASYLAWKVFQLPPFIFSSNLSSGLCIIAFLLPSPGAKRLQMMLLPGLSWKGGRCTPPIFSAVKNPLQKFRDECEMTPRGRVRRLHCSRQNGQRENQPRGGSLC